LGLWLQIATALSHKTFAKANDFASKKRKRKASLSSVAIAQEFLLEHCAYLVMCF